jgi:hypothetical protein
MLASLLYQNILVTFMRSMSYIKELYLQARLLGVMWYLRNHGYESVACSKDPLHHNGNAKVYNAKSPVMLETRERKVEIQF